MSLLGDLVRHVFFLGAEKKMVGIDAGPHIAAMADQQSGGDRSAIHRPRRPVRLPAMPLEREISIAVGRAAAGPEDAAGLGITNTAVLQALLQRPVARTKRTHRYSYATRARILRARGKTTYSGQWRAE
jgi:hypothetical protein